MSKGPGRLQKRIVRPLVRFPEGRYPRDTTIFMYGGGYTNSQYEIDLPSIADLVVGEHMGTLSDGLHRALTRGIRARFGGPIDPRTRP